ncbi:MAG: hypothetical protein Q9207_001887 [Kuettlingeria erythrocarpa]
MSAAFPRFKYIISKRLDPIFAVFVGLSAATIRIRREEIEKGHTGGMNDIGAKIKRRGIGVWKGDFDIQAKEAAKVER